MSDKNRNPKGDQNRYYVKQYGILWQVYYNEFNYHGMAGGFYWSGTLQHSFESEEKANAHAEALNIQFNCISSSPNLESL